MSAHAAAGPQATVLFQVGITYCDGRVLLHDFSGSKAVKSSTQEYAEMLAEALQPSVSLPHARHIRMVTLIGFDADHLPVHHIHSGLIGCTHRKG